MSDTLTDALEALVDRYGMTRIVEELAEISAQKADHVRETWQD